MREQIQALINKVDEILAVRKLTDFQVNLLGAFKVTLKSILDSSVADL